MNAKDAAQFAHSAIEDPTRVVTVAGTELNNTVVIGFNGSEKLPTRCAHCTKTRSQFLFRVQRTQFRREELSNAKN